MKTTAFWFLVAYTVLGLLGACVRIVEREPAKPPTAGVAFFGLLLGIAAFLAVLELAP